jgi:hypothetical protein
VNWLASFRRVRSRQLLTVKLPLGPMRLSPPYHVAWPDRTYGPWDVELRFAPLAGRWELADIRIHPAPLGLTADDPDLEAQPEPGPLTTALIRSLPLSQLTAEWRTHVHDSNRELVDIGAVWIAGLAGESWEGRREERLDSDEAVAWLDEKSGGSKGGRPTHWTNRRLTEVAKVYADAYAAGKSPTAAVRTHFKIGPSGAAKLVSLARSKGRLPPTKKGKAGWLPTHRRSEEEKA